MLLKLYVTTMKLKMPTLGPERTESKFIAPSNDVSFTLTRECQMVQPVSLSRTGLIMQIIPTPCHLAPLLRVSPFEFMKKLYGP